MTRILGISRHPRFSPNSEERDAAIFAKVCEKLAAHSVEVMTYPEAEVKTFLPQDWAAVQPDVVFSMARFDAVLCQLEVLSQQSIPVLNQPTALRTASRESFYHTLHQAGLPWVETHLLRPATDCFPPCDYPLWLKRNDARSEVAGDVAFVTDADTYLAAMSDFVQRGVDEVVATPHVEGDLIKFYGVKGTDFFYYYYPTAENDFSKFGLERHNGSPQGFQLNETYFKSIADQTAHLTGLTIYGGDAVLTEQGEIYLIDFNDFPSFSRCRDAAATAIAECVLREIRRE